MKTVYKVAITASPFFLFIVLASPVHAEPYGWSPQVDFSNQGPPSHTGPKLEKPPILLLPNHPSLPRAQGPGAVRLQWHKVPGATGYNIYYGLSPKNYIYSVPDLPETDNFTINYLANRVYYVAIQAKQGYSVSDLSNEFTMRPGGGGYAGTNSVLGIGDVQAVQPVVRKNAYAPPPYEEEETNVQGAMEESNEESGYDSPAYEPPVYQLPTTAPSLRNQPTPTPAKKGFWQNLLNALGLSR